MDGGHWLTYRLLARGYYVLGTYSVLQRIAHPTFSMEKIFNSTYTRKLHSIHSFFPFSEFCFSTGKGVAVRMRVLNTTLEHNGQHNPTLFGIHPPVLMPTEHAALRNCKCRKKKLWEELWENVPFCTPIKAKGLLPRRPTKPR